MPRALLLSYHFPPSQAAGATRWAAFTQAGVARGWSFDVLSVTPGYSPASHAPAGSTGDIRVHVVPQRSGAFATAAGRIIKLANRIRPVSRVRSAPLSAASIPDQVVRREDLSRRLSVENGRKAFRVLLHHSAELEWMRCAQEAGELLAASAPYDAVISSGPPHLSAEAARRISERFEIPLVVDFRDPWAQIDMLQQDVASPLHFAIARRYETMSMRRAALVVMNTDAAARAMRAAYPEQKVITVRNGFDKTAPLANHGAKFVAIYAGAIYLDRDPRPLLRALQIAASRTSITPETFVLRFIGSDGQFGGTDLKSLASEAGVSALVDVEGPLNRDRLHEQMASAALLVNLPQGARLCIPSKIYEYLSFPSWLLAMEPEVSATRDLLRETSADVRQPTDVEGIAEVIRNRFEQYSSGVRPVPIGVSGEFSAHVQASRFLDALEQLRS